MVPPALTSIPRPQWTQDRLSAPSIHHSSSLAPQKFMIRLSNSFLIHPRLHSARPSLDSWQENVALRCCLYSTTPTPLQHHSNTTPCTTYSHKLPAHHTATAPHFIPTYPHTNTSQNSPLKFAPVASAAGELILSCSRSWNVGFSTLFFLLV